MNRFVAVFIYALPPSLLFFIIQETISGKMQAIFEVIYLVLLWFIFPILGRVLILAEPILPLDRYVLLYQKLDWKAWCC
jgi:hypothetical protein